MKIAQRYRILQRIVYVQSALTLAFGLYVLNSAKREDVYNVTVQESKPVDLSFLDMITNRPPRLVDATRATSAVDPRPGDFTPVHRVPFRFDGYFRSGGDDYVTIEGFYYRKGDRIHGLEIESISPDLVKVDGQYYTIARSRAIQNQEVN